MRLLRTLIALGAVLAGCSLLVDGELDGVRCEAEGSIGPPACEVGQVCGLGRCHDCTSREACGDGVDNDCSRAIDDGCPDLGAGGATGM